MVSMIKKHNSKKRDNKNKPFKYIGQITPEEFLRRIDEIIRLKSNRISFKKQLYSQVIGLLFIRHHPMSLTQIGIFHFIADKNAWVFSNNRKICKLKIGRYDTERKNIKSILEPLVEDGLIYNLKREYKSWYDIINSNRDGKFLDKYLKNSLELFKKLYSKKN